MKEVDGSDSKVSTGLPRELADGVAASVAGGLAGLQMGRMQVACLVNYVTK